MKRFRDTNYFISEDGKVFRQTKTKLKEVKIKLSKDGYLIVGLSKNNERKFYRVHRLVSECYIPNPNNLPQVNHINGIKTDNKVDNLEWVTPEQNMQHSYMNRLSPVGEKHWKSKLTNEQADWIRKNYTYKHPDFNSVKLGKQFGVGHAQILKIVKNKNWNYA